MKKFILTIISIFLLSAMISMPVLAISTSDAVINIDFKNGIPEGMEIVGAELVNDDVKGQVMSFAGGPANKKNGSNSKAELPMESLAKTDFSKGISWTVWVKGTPETHGMQPIFNINLTRIGYLALLADLVVTANSDGNETKWGIERVWSDPPGPLEDEESAIGTDWNQFTVVINDEAVYLYKNAKRFDINPWAQGSFGNDGMTTVMMEQMAYATGISLGAYKCDWWKFGDFKGFISSAALYNKALSADEVKELFVASGGIYEEEPVTEAPTIPVTDPPAPPAENITETIAENIETSEAVKSDDKESSNNSLLLIIFGAVVVLCVIIIPAAIRNNKKKKAK